VGEPAVSIRDARPADEPRLRAVAAAAKGHWGYDREAVERWAGALGLPVGGEAFVADRGGRVLAWASLLGTGERAVLEDLWVEPEAMAQGLGRLLFEEARARARRRGARVLEWEAEPNAIGFYERVGGRVLRTSEPTIWGRVLPVMGVELEPSAPAEQAP
jgi:GNAT superfamily N-acetyltransferase